MSLAPPPPASRDQRIELKYVIDPITAQEVQAWATDHLDADPHCGHALDDSYDVHTLYLDTPALDIYHRQAGLGGTKYRIRRYESEDVLWLESKRKRKDVVRKLRTKLTAAQMMQHVLANDEISAAPSCADWFTAKIRRWHLQPAIQVHYRRFARIGEVADENVRLTIDSRLQASHVAGWMQSAVLDRDLPVTRHALPTVHILELKFSQQLPELFKQLLREFHLPAGSYSKYRTSLDLAHA